MTQAAFAPSVTQKISQAPQTIEFARGQQTGQRSSKQQLAPRDFAARGAASPSAASPKFQAKQKLTELQQLTPPAILEAGITGDAENVFKAMKALPVAQRDKYFKDVAVILGIKIDATELKEVLARETMPKEFAKAFGLAVQNPVRYIEDATKAAKMAEAAKDNTPTLAL